jgi:hypothetical protein
LAGATALVTARANGSFTDAHQRFWDGARRFLGDASGTRALIGVLLLHRTLPAAAVTAGMDAAVALGAFDPDVVAVQARHTLEPDRAHRPVPVPQDADRAGVLRPVPVLTGYDDLLASTNSTTAREVSA